MSRPQGFDTIPDYKLLRFSAPERAGYSKIGILVGDVAVVDVRMPVLVLYMIALGENKRPAS